MFNLVKYDMRYSLGDMNYDSCVKNPKNFSAFTSLWWNYNKLTNKIICSVQPSTLAWFSIYAIFALG